MKRAAALSAVLIALSAFQVFAQEQAPPRPRTPRLTTEDVESSKAGRELRGATDEVETRPAEKGKGESAAAKVSNPRQVLEQMFTRLGAAKSVRIRSRISTPNGELETVVENVKPDRARVVSQDSEFIVIGCAFYMRRGGGAWQTSSMPASALDQLNMGGAEVLKQLFSIPGVTMSARITRSEVIDGVDTVGYEFSITDRQGAGTIEAFVGKTDGLPRRLFVSGPGLNMKAWYSGFDDGITIEPPQM